MSNTCSKWASKSGFSCPSCSGEGSSLVLLEVSSSVLSSSSCERASVNDGDLVACVVGLATAAGAMNGEKEGSPDKVNTPDVSTLRTGSSVVTLGKRSVRSSASSLLLSI